MPYVDVTIQYKGQEVTFSQIEFEDDTWSSDDDLNRVWVEEDFIDDARLTISNVEYGTRICQHCNGSGEGPADGTSCSFCRGRGEKSFRRVSSADCQGRKTVTRQPESDLGNPAVVGPQAIMQRRCEAGRSGNDDLLLSTVWKPCRAIGVCYGRFTAGQRSNEIEAI
jgi:hypothetical protein